MAENKIPDLDKRWSYADQDRIMDQLAAFYTAAAEKYAGSEEGEQAGRIRDMLASFRAEAEPTEERDVNQRPANLYGEAYAAAVRNLPKFPKARRAVVNLGRSLPKVIGPSKSPPGTEELLGPRFSMRDLRRQAAKTKGLEVPGDRGVMAPLDVRPTLPGLLTAPTRRELAEQQQQIAEIAADPTNKWAWWGRGDQGTAMESRRRLASLAAEGPMPFERPLDYRREHPQALAKRVMEAPMGMLGLIEEITTGQPAAHGADYTQTPGFMPEAPASMPEYAGPFAGAMGRLFPGAANIPSRYMERLQGEMQEGGSLGASPALGLGGLALGHAAGAVREAGLPFKSYVEQELEPRTNFGAAATGLGVQTAADVATYGGVGKAAHVVEPAVGAALRRVPGVGGILKRAPTAMDELSASMAKRGVAQRGEGLGAAMRSPTGFVGRQAQGLAAQSPRIAQAGRAGLPFYGLHAGAAAATGQDLPGLGLVPPFSDPYGWYQNYTTMGSDTGEDAYNFPTRALAAVGAATNIYSPEGGLAQDVMFPLAFGRLMGAGKLNLRARGGRGKPAGAEGEVTTPQPGDAARGMTLPTGGKKFKVAVDEAGEQTGFVPAVKGEKLAWEKPTVGTLKTLTAEELPKYFDPQVVDVSKLRGTEVLETFGATPIGEGEGKQVLPVPRKSDFGNYRKFIEEGEGLNFDDQLTRRARIVRGEMPDATLDERLTGRAARAYELLMNSQLPVVFDMIREGKIAHPRTLTPEVLADIRRRAQGTDSGARMFQDYLLAVRMNDWIWDKQVGLEFETGMRKEAIGKKGKEKGGEAGAAGAESTADAKSPEWNEQQLWHTHPDIRRLKAFQPFRDKNPHLMEPEELTTLITAMGKRLANSKNQTALNALEQLRAINAAKIAARRQKPEQGEDEEPPPDEPSPDEPSPDETPDETPPDETPPAAPPLNAEMLRNAERQVEGRSALRTDLSPTERAERSEQELQDTITKAKERTAPQTGEEIAPEQRQARIDEADYLADPNYPDGASRSEFMEGVLGAVSRGDTSFLYTLRHNLRQLIRDWAAVGRGVGPREGKAEPVDRVIKNAAARKAESPEEAAKATARIAAGLRARDVSLDELITSATYRGFQEPGRTETAQAVENQTYIREIQREALNTLVVAPREVIQPPSGGDPTRIVANAIQLPEMARAIRKMAEGYDALPRDALNKLADNIEARYQSIANRIAQRAIEVDRHIAAYPGTAIVSGNIRSGFFSSAETNPLLQEVRNRQTHVNLALAYRTFEQGRPGETMTAKRAEQTGVARVVNMESPNIRDSRDRIRPENLLVTLPGNEILLMEEGKIAEVIPVREDFNLQSYRPEKGTITVNGRELLLEDVNVRARRSNLVDHAGNRLSVSQIHQLLNWIYSGVRERLDGTRPKGEPAFMTEGAYREFFARLGRLPSRTLSTLAAYLFDQPRTATAAKGTVWDEISGDPIWGRSDSIANPNPRYTPQLMQGIYKILQERGNLNPDYIELIGRDDLPIPEYTERAIDTLAPEDRPTRFDSEGRELGRIGGKKYAQPTDAPELPRMGDTIARRHLLENLIRMLDRYRFSKRDKAQPFIETTKEGFYALRNMVEWLNRLNEEDFNFVNMEARQILAQLSQYKENINPEQIKSDMDASIAASRLTQELDMPAEAARALVDALRGKKQSGASMAIDKLTYDLLEMIANVANYRKAGRKDSAWQAPDSELKSEQKQAAAQMEARRPSKGPEPTLEDVETYEPIGAPEREVPPGAEGLPELVEAVGEEAAQASAGEGSYIIDMLSRAAKRESSIAGYESTTRHLEMALQAAAKRPDLFEMANGEIIDPDVLTLAALVRKRGHTNWSTEDGKLANSLSVKIANKVANAGLPSKARTYSARPNVEKLLGTRRPTEPVGGEKVERQEQPAHIYFWRLLARRMTNRAVRALRDYEELQKKAVDKSLDEKARQDAQAKLQEAKDTVERLVGKQREVLVDTPRGKKRRVEQTLGPAAMVQTYYGLLKEVETSLAKQIIRVYEARKRLRKLRAGKTIAELPSVRSTTGKFEDSLLEDADTAFSYRNKLIAKAVEVFGRDIVPEPLMEEYERSREAPASEEAVREYKVDMERAFEEASPEVKAELETAIPVPKKSAVPEPEGGWPIPAKRVTITLTEKVEIVDGKETVSEPTDIWVKTPNSKGTIDAVEFFDLVKEGKIDARSIEMLSIPAKIITRNKELAKYLRTIMPFDQIKAEAARQAAARMLVLQRKYPTQKGDEE